MVISDLNPEYCSIRDGVVTVNGNILYADNHQEGDEPFIIKAYRSLGISYPKFFKMDSLSKTGFLAAELLLKGTATDNQELKSNIAVILMTGNASLDTDLNFQSTIDNPAAYFPSPSIFVYTLPNIMLGEICIRFKITGEGIVFIDREINGTVLYEYIDTLFTDGITDSCLFGWVDYLNGKAEAFISVIHKDMITQSFNQHSFNSFIQRTFRTSNHQH
ncbi:MAG TPA: hypothetical protein PKH02_11250 [Bacteroidales bacterium]|nr:hypothetical protein [Bacteroidales bacterium]HPT12431.1 hypothetical protein [Bacteroidales bacterium]